MSPSRRLILAFAILLLIVLGVLVPGLLYTAEASLRGLRLLWWLLLLLGALLWLLAHPVRRR